MALGEELRAAVGPSFAGIWWRSSTSVEVYGTSSEASTALLDVGQRSGIEIVFRQVPATSGELDEAISWLGQHIRSPALDARTAYVDVTCGAVVVIVGDNDSQAALQEVATEAGRLRLLDIVVDPDYVTSFRGAPPAIDSGGEPSGCPRIRCIGLDASEYLDLIEEQAVTQALEAGLRLIVECRDGETIPPPRLADIDNTRLWVSIDDGVVTSAYRVCTSQ